MDYTISDEEAEGMLRRAFVEHRVDFVVVSSRRQWRQILAIGYAEGRGWVKGEFHEIDTQSSCMTYRLTDEGRKHFGLA